MPAHRKTVDINAIIEMANTLLKESTSPAGKHIRHGVQLLLEDILHESGNYRGFRYLNQSEVPEGDLPGIIWNGNDDGSHSFPDETRVQYYGNPNI